MNEEEHQSQSQSIQIQRIDRGLLHPSPTNPRKHAEAKPLQELADSIAEKGIKQPLLVRPSAEVAGGFEIIAGERRWRAHGLALEQMLPGVLQQAEQVPCIVEVMSDAEVMEIQLIENLQRVDLTPMEEADGYAAMLRLRHELTGDPLYTVEAVAAKLGRSPASVYQALKWQRLPTLARAAMEQGYCGKELATLLGRIPDEMARRRATLEIIFFPDESFLNDEEGNLVDAERDAAGILKSEPETLEPMKVQAAREHLREHYMATLKDVRFDLEEADLVPVMVGDDGERVGGGDCGSCPFRTGNAPEYAETVTAMQPGRGSTGGIDPHVCTLPSCRAAKVRAQAERDIAAASKHGAEIVSGEAARKLFVEGHKGWVLRSGGIYVELDEKPGFNLVGHVNSEKVKTWKKLLHKVELPEVVLVDPAGCPHFVIEREKAVLAVNLAAIKSGKESPFVRASAAKDRPVKMEQSGAIDASESDLMREVEQQRAAEREKEAAEKRKAAEKKKLEQATSLKAVAMVMDAVITRGGLGREDWDFIVELALPEAGADGVTFMAAMLGVKPEKPKAGQRLAIGDYIAAIMEHLRAMERPKAAMEALLVAILVAQQTQWNGTGSTRLKACMKRWEVSEVEARQLAKDEKKAEGGKRKAEGAALKTETRSEAMARNEAGHASEQMAENEAARQQGYERECAHCREMIRTADEAEFFEHVKKCSKRPAKKKAVKKAARS